MKTYLLFKDGKLVTVVQTKIDNIRIGELGRGCYLVEDPQDAEKQIAEWKK